LFDTFSLLPQVVEEKDAKTAFSTDAVLGQQGKWQASLKADATKKKCEEAQ